ncbi:Fc receptor-like protein 5 [Xiphias gladius]|uniref:Fc receptor-like protein 5 n=1 Tax=Xiphias gladius TaxID=8245 RepID=UPI001A99C7DF|nr:Fc receptor-like protein 5 [Xiphias gladius]
MDIPSLCLFISATLRVHPDRSQFFPYETLALTCAVPGNFSGWTVVRNTSSESFQSCEAGWGRTDAPSSSCTIGGIYLSESGPYWCESKRGECSNVLNIRVHAGVVILESPALPVTEGDSVTLRCSYKVRPAKPSTSAFNATFYRNGVIVGTQPDGKMILPAVSKSDEGFYKCQHPTKAESLQSLLVVRVRAQPGSESVPATLPDTSVSHLRLACAVLLFSFYNGIMIVFVHKYRRWARARAEAKRRASDRLARER